MDREEYKKCCESPAYFFNNYVMVKDANGNWVKPNPITDEQIAKAEEKARKEEWKRRDAMKTNMAKTIIKMFPDAFKGKVVLTAKVREDLLNTPIKKD